MSDLARARGARAKALIEDELLVEAFKELESAYIEKWRSTNIHDVQGREKLFIAINVVGKVRDHLARVMADGNLAQAELKRMTQAPKRFGII